MMMMVADGDGSSYQTYSYVEEFPDLRVSYIQYVCIESAYITNIRQSHAISHG